MKKWVVVYDNTIIIKGTGYRSDVPRYVLPEWAKRLIRWVKSWRLT